MTRFDCTHIVLYSGHLPSTHDFYAGLLKCSVRVYNEEILGVDVGRLFINFYPAKVSSIQSSVNHLGLELPTRVSVEEWFTYLSGEGAALHLSRVQTKNRERQSLRSLEQLQANQVSGPYRFYLIDPDGLWLELHTWEGADF